MPKHFNFPSLFDLEQRVTFKLDEEDYKDSHDATIKAVHFYPGKVKYDLEVIAGDGKPTRLYNIDSIWVK